MHQTSVRYGRRRGISTSLTHSFSKNSAKTDGVDLESDTQVFKNTVTIPLRHWNHKIDLRNGANTGLRQPRVCQRSVQHRDRQQLLVRCPSSEAGTAE